MRITAVLAIALLATAANAQQSDSVSIRRDAAPARFGAAFGGAALGMIGGAYIAYNAFPNDCCGDDPGLANILYGGALGLWLGGALGAAGPDLKSVCSFRKRFVRSLAGSIAGSFAGAAAGAGGGGGFFLVTLPIGAGAGGALTLGPCWKSKH